jgi:hypothetical protein
MNFANYKTTLTIPLIGVLWVGASWGLSKIWGYGFLQGIGPTAIVGGLLWAYDKWAWKWPVFSLLRKVPDIGGVYTGKVNFRFGDQAGEKDCTMRIKQTCSHIKVECEFSKVGESNTKSTSKEAIITSDAIGDYELIFLYHNPGSQLSGDPLTAHEGTNILKISKNEGSIRLSGFYYTNREPQTKGTIDVVRTTES